MIETSLLCKSFRDPKKGMVEAVRDISFQCRPGEVFGLLGPNGAGKTTTLRMIATALKPTGGRGAVMGHDLAAAPEAVRANIGFLSANTGMYGRLTPRETLEYFGALYRLPRPQVRLRIDELAAEFGMGEFLDRPCDKLSTGMKQKANIARTVLHDPPAMVFDEPTGGLDVLTSRAILQFIQRCRQAGKTVLLSTHIMDEVRKLCDRVAIMSRGRILWQGTVDELRRQRGDDLDEAFAQMILEDAA